MLNTFLLIALALAIVIAAIFAVASMRPDTFAIQRSAGIKAPPERLFALINDLKAMSTWNPYSLRETTGTGTVDYSGPASGKGAKSTFAGPKSGTGSIEIVDAAAPSKVTMRLLMTAPFKADNTVEFTLKPDGAQTTVTWAMSGKQPLLAKAMTLFIDCDKMVGKDFEEGLANLKALAGKP